MEEINALYRLSTLYMLSRVEFPISTNRLSFFLLQQNYTDYFTFQQGLGELLYDGYVKKELVHGKTLYSITDAGRDAIGYLKKEISADMRNDIDNYIRENRMPMHEDCSIVSKSYQLDLTHYMANLVVEEEGIKILEMNIATTTAEEADRICANWKESNEEIYPMLIDMLMKNKKKPEQ